MSGTLTASTVKPGVRRSKNIHLEGYVNLIHVRQ